MASGPEPVRPSGGHGPIVFGLVLIIVLLVLLAALAPLFEGWTFTRSVEVDRGTYFRLKLDFAYKGTPQNYDVVYGCNVRQIRYKDGSRTVEAGMAPALYGRRMDDGQLVAVRTPLACRGETTANGRVPEHVLPLMIVYRDADAPAFGIGYISDEAYDSPLSELRFGRAVIEAATEGDYRAFRARADNALARPRPGKADIVEDALTIEEARYAGFEIGTVCRAALRTLIPEGIRDFVRAEWPADRPRYWGSKRRQEGVPYARREVGNYIIDHGGLVVSDRPEDGTKVLVDMRFSDGSPDGGMPNRYGETVRNLYPRWPGAYYPLESEAALRRWLTGAWAPPWRFDDQRVTQNAVDVRSGLTRGFAYCGRGYEHVDNSVKVDGITARPEGWGSAFENDTYLYLTGEQQGAYAFGGMM